MSRRPYSMTRRETIRNSGLQDPRLQIGDWVLVSLMSAEGPEPEPETPSVEAFNAVEAGLVDYYDEFAPSISSGSTQLDHSIDMG